MDGDWTRLIIALVTWAASAGAIAVMVRRNTGDIADIKREKAACQAGMVQKWHDLDKRVTVIDANVKRVLRILNGDE